MKNFKILLSLMDYLKDFLPFNRDEKLLDKEVLAFFRLYQKLGGKIVKTDKGIEIPESFEITLRLLDGEKVVLKEKRKKKTLIFGCHYFINDSFLKACSSVRSVDIFSDITEPSCMKVRSKREKFKNKNRTGSKITKQNRS